MIHPKLFRAPLIIKYTSGHHICIGMCISILFPPYNIVLLSHNIQNIPAKSGDKQNNNTTLRLIWLMPIPRNMTSHNTSLSKGSSSLTNTLTLYNWDLYELYMRYLPSTDFGWLCCVSQERSFMHMDDACHDNNRSDNSMAHQTMNVHEGNQVE